MYKNNYLYFEPYHRKFPLLDTVATAAVVIGIRHLQHALLSRLPWARRNLTWRGLCCSQNALERCVAIGCFLLHQELQHHGIADSRVAGGQIQVSDVTENSISVERCYGKLKIIKVSDQFVSRGEFCRDLEKWKVMMDDCRAAMLVHTSALQSIHDHRSRGSTSCSCTLIL